MKALIIALFIYVSFVPGVKAQTDKWYVSSGTEFIFSWANIDDNGYTDGSIMRWSPVFNWQTLVNRDFSEHVGVYTGLDIKNVGFIYRQSDNVKKKYRTYNLGIPVGFKIGNLDGFSFYFGYEMEFPIHYKEKTFVDEKKEKFGVWFSNRVPAFYNTLFAGFQLPYGANLKFKYYLTNFHNRGFTLSDESKPYQGLNANVFYMALSFNIFRNNKLYYHKKSDDTYSMN